MNLSLKKAKDFILEYNTLIIFLIMIVVSTSLSNVFFSHVNLSNLLRQVAGIGIISMGMLLVIIIGGIDLSVGSVLALAGVLLAYFTQSMPLSVALLLTCICGLAIGLVSGYLSAYGRLAPFIVTLAVMTIARGLAFMVSKGAPIMVNENAQGLMDFGNGYILGLPLPVLLFFSISALVFVMLKYNVAGRIIIAIGSNEEGVRLSGIKINQYKLALYGFSGTMAALAGIIATSRTGIGSPVIGTGLELDAIAAVVVGGASLKGGRGSAFNTLLGVLILGMIGNIMNLKDVPAYPQQVIKGVIIILAVLLQRFKQK
jgi:ribose transport system permease protein